MNKEEWIGLRRQAQIGINGIHIKKTLDYVCKRARILTPIDEHQWNINSKATRVAYCCLILEAAEKLHHGWMVGSLCHDKHSFAAS